MREFPLWKLVPEGLFFVSGGGGEGKMPPKPKLTVDRVYYLLRDTERPINKKIHTTQLNNKNQKGFPRPWVQLSKSMLGFPN